MKNLLEKTLFGFVDILLIPLRLLTKRSSKQNMPGNAGGYVLLGSSSFALSDHLKAGAKEIWAPCEGAEGGAGGCADCEGGGGDCADGCGNVSFSTPFLCLWNGERYVFENDFLLGNPSTLYQTFEQGEKAFKEGRTAPDLYCITGDIISRNGNIAMQLREVEEEESFIDSIALRSIVYPKGFTPVVNSTHKSFQLLANIELAQKSPFAQSFSCGSQQVKPSLAFRECVLDGQSSEEYVLERGEYIEIDARAHDTNTSFENLVLLVRSRYRDWSAGNFAEQSAHYISSLSPLSHTTVKKSLFVPALLVSIFLWMGGVFGYAAERLGFSPRESVAKGGAPLSVNLPLAHADAGHTHSLIIQCWDWARNTFVQTEVIQPRHHQRVTEAVAIPPHHVNADGVVRIRIIATERHVIDLASLFVPETTAVPVREEYLGLQTAEHSRLGDVSEHIRNPRSGTYTHLVPGDVVDVAFNASTTNLAEDVERAYFFESLGFYTPLSGYGKQVAGNWEQSLDAESKAFVANMRSLATEK